MVPSTEGAEIQVSIQRYATAQPQALPMSVDLLFPAVAKKPVPVTSEMELRVMKNKVAELRAQHSSRERASSTSGEGFNIVSDQISDVGCVTWCDHDVRCVTWCESMM